MSIFEHLPDAKFGGGRQHAEGLKGTEQKLRPVTQCSLVQRTSERERKKHISGANADRRAAMLIKIRGLQRTKKLLSDAQWWSAGDPVLLCLSLPGIRRRRRVECRCADRAQTEHRLGCDRAAVAAMSLGWSQSLLLIGGTVLVSIAGTLIVRRLISVEVLERHNAVAGFIYAVIGVVYAVLLGFAAITVWERYDRAQAAVEQEADDLGDLYRDAQTFPSDVRAQLEHQIRDYVRLAVQKEWPAMAGGKSSPEVWDAYMQLWRTYYQFSPGTDQEKTWYSQSLTKLNDLSNERRMRLLTSRLGSVPVMMWLALLGTGIITIAFSFLFGTKNAMAQIVMSAGLAFTVALVMVAIIALGQPFAGISRVGPQPFEQLEGMFKHLEGVPIR
jgi:hypothetical protein